MTRRLPGIEGWCEPDRLDVQPSLSDFVSCRDWEPTTRLTGQRKANPVFKPCACDATLRQVLVYSIIVPCVSCHNCPTPHGAGSTRSTCRRASDVSVRQKTQNHNTRLHVLTVSPSHAGRVATGTVARQSRLALERAVLRRRTWWRPSWSGTDFVLCKCQSLTAWIILDVLGCVNIVTARSMLTVHGRVDIGTA